MSWTKLKNFALIVLIIINVVLACLIFNSIKEANNYSKDSITNLIEVLRKKNIIVDREIIQTNKIDMNVYGISYDEAAYMSVLNTFVGKNVFFNGDSYAASSAYGNYTIGKDFSFDFSSAETVDTDTAKIELTEWSLVSKYSNLSKQFLNHGLISKDGINNSAIKKTEFKDIGLYRYNDGSYEMKLVEYIGNYETGNTVTVNFIGEKVVKATGKMTFVMPNVSYKAKNVDVFNILSSEKRFFENYSYNVLTVSSIDYGYEMIFDVYGNGFLLPICKVSYINGIVHIYDLVTGEMVAQYE